MIITKFNSYFDKHGKATYLVLCIIIAVIFVFTIGSGDSSCTGQERLTSIGHMYGRNLALDDITRKGAQIRLFYAMNNQRIPSRTNDYKLIQMTLDKMRLVHEAHEKKLDNITDEDFANAILALPYWKISDKDHSGNELDSTETIFTQNRFNRFLENIVKRQFGLSGEDFDEMIKDEILANRVIDSVTKDLKADEAAVKTVAAESTLRIAMFPMNLDRDSRPADSEIDAFLKTRAAELTDKDRMTNFFLVAYREYSDIIKAAENDKELAKEINPSDAEIKAFFDKNATVLFKDKKLDDVKEQIVKSLKATKAESWLNARFAAFKAEISKPVPEKSNRYAQFMAAARANKLSIARQNGVPEGSLVNDIDLPQKPLAEAIKAIKALDTPTAMTALAGDAGDNGFAIAMKVDNPNKENNIRDAAATILCGEKAQVLFEEKVMKPYQEKLAGKKSIDELTAAEFKTDAKQTMENPASYVADIAAMDTVDKIILPFVSEKDGKLEMAKPDKKDARLLSWYRRELAAAAAKARAEEALASFQKALKDGKTLQAADTQKRFTDAQKPLSWFNAINSALQIAYQQMYTSKGNMTPMMLKYAQRYGFTMAGTQAGAPAQNLPELIADLDKLGDNALLGKAVATNRGYMLVYQVKRELPATDEGKKQTEAAQEMILNQLKSRAIDALKTDLLAKSNTRLVEEIMPREQAEAAK